MPIIPGILCISNKTYGRTSNGTFLYKCILYNNNSINICSNDNGRSLDATTTILVPYKRDFTKFNKNNTSLYVLINVPEGAPNEIPLVRENLGPVDSIQSYSMFMMHRYNLVYSFKKFNEKLRMIEGPKIVSERALERASERTIYSIDPIGCKDIDDAFSIHEKDKKTFLSIYISDVPEVIDRYNLWDLVTDRTSTIYLSEQNYLMLPPKLSEELCSLRADNIPRDVIVLELIIDETSITDSRIYKDHVIVTKNLSYESIDPICNSLIEITEKINKSENVFEEPIKDTHKAIELLMILFNRTMASMLSFYDQGIFRVTDDSLAESSNDSAKEFLKLFENSIYGSYSLEKRPHSILNIDLYAHCSSPIRRIVDLINLSMFKIIIEKGNEYIHSFINKWKFRIEFINKSMKIIKKIQKHNLLLNLFLGGPERIYYGISYGKFIYFKDINFIMKNKEEASQEASKEATRYKIYVFEDETTFNKKIKVSRIQ